MTTALRTTAVGVFENQGNARLAVEELRRAGFSAEDIGFIARDLPAGSTPDGAQRPETQASEGAVAGTALGSLIGIQAGVAVASGLITPLGPVIAGGALAGLLASLATGAAVGGVVGGLIGLGVPNEDIEFYEHELGAGRTLVIVKTDEHYDEAALILMNCGATGRSISSF